MPNYLLEIGTEELPASYVQEAQERLKNILADTLAEERIAFKSISAYGTPRRLSVIVNDIAPVQSTVNKKVKGPPVKSSFDASGKALPSAAGFAQKHGLKVEELKQEDMGGTVYLVADLQVKGEPIASVFKEAIPNVIGKISGERLMRWGNGDFKFSRPIRWIVSLLDKEELKIELSGISSERFTFGNRVLAPEKISIASVDTYVDTLKKAKVLVDSTERRKVIENEVIKAASTVSGKPRQLSGPLLDEVINITEWPSAVVGEFAKEYLDLPDTLIETVMIHHQRYFPVEQNSGNEKKLLPYFIAIANNDSSKAQSNIKQGTERVLKARLADGRFFYFDDLKTKLSKREEQLKQLTFQEGLGSYFDKSERLKSTAAVIADSLSLDSKISKALARTAELCKNDLVTNLVRELPELQGHVGSWYAENEKEEKAVSTAIASHYSPRTHDDGIPEDIAGRFISLIDKCDNLAGLFALGRRASGSSDPYALRRQCQGVVDILIDGLPEYRINVSVLMELLLNAIEAKLTKKKNFDFKATLSDLKEFLLSRIKVKLADKGFNKDIIESVLSVGDPLTDTKDLLDRCQCLIKVTTQDKGLDLIRAGVRIGNILNGSENHGSVNPKLLVDSHEIALWTAFEKEVVDIWEKNSSFAQPNSCEQYIELTQLLSKLVQKVDAFFDNVMVNDPDMEKRRNRQGLLAAINQYFSAIADFKKLQPLLP